MIAGEKKFLAIQKNNMAARVSRRRDDEQVLVESNRLLAFDNSFNAYSRGAVFGVHHTLAAKLISKQLMISNIVAVR